MITYNEALTLIKDSVNWSTRKEKEEEVPLLKSLGRVLSRKILAQEENPLFDNSAMDGFLICSEDTLSASPDQPVLLKTLPHFHIAAGDETPPNHFDHSQIQAIEIMTGARVWSLPSEMNAKFNAVVRVEDVEIVNNGIRIRKPVSKYENIRRRGDDYQSGDLLLREGNVIQSASIMAMASQGIQNIYVRKPLRVMVLSTGKELLAWDVPMDSETIVSRSSVRNSTAPYLKIELEKNGVDIISMDQIADDSDSFRQYLKKVENLKPDILITTAAVSKGKYDFIPDELEHWGAKTVFHGCYVRPGKPILFSFHKELSLFVWSLPGNPISSAMGFHFFVEPHLNVLLGVKTNHWRIHAPLFNGLKKPKDFFCFYRGWYGQNVQGVWGVQVFPKQSSFQISSLAQGNVWVLLPEGKSEFREGDIAELKPM